MKPQLALAVAAVVAASSSPQPTMVLRNTNWTTSDPPRLLKFSAFGVPNVPRINQRQRRKQARRRNPHGF